MKKKRITGYKKDAFRVKLFELVLKTKPNVPVHIGLCLL